MYLTELALQGVRGFSPSSRVTFKPGYWTLQVPAPNAAPLAGLWTTLCFAGGRDADYLAPGGKGGKAGLLLLGNDGVNYRLMRELGRGGALHRLPPGAQAYEPVTTEPLEITSFVRSQVGLPDKKLFEALFCLTTAHLPSRRPTKSAAAARESGVRAAVSASAWAGMMENTQTAADPTTRIQELERELRLTKEVDDLQFRSDGLASQIFEAEQKLSSPSGLDSQVKAARAAYEAAPSVQNLKLPADILARVERAPLAEQKLAEGLAKLQVERATESTVLAPQVEPLIKDRRFWAGMGLGVCTLLGGALLTGPLKYVALLDIPAFGMPAMLAYKYVEDVARVQRSGRKGDRLVEREKKLREAHALEVGPVKQAMNVLKVETPQELVEILGRRPILGAKLKELEHQLAQMKEDPALQEAEAELGRLKVEQEQLTADIAKKGAYVRDLREIEREMARMKEALAGGGRAPGVAGAAAGALEDPMPELMAQAGELFGVDMFTAAAQVSDRASQYFNALTEKRFSGLAMNKDGTGVALGGSGKVPLTTLSPKDLDWAYLAVRLTVLEKYSAHYKVPFLVESVLDGLDPNKVPLLARMLKHLGTLTQVLQVTSNPAFTQAADGAVQV